jgi:hypothetical protein
VSHPSRWHNFVPPAHSDSNPEVFFGCQVWSAERDLAMGRQDPATGLWFPGDHRRGDLCLLCGGVPGENVYCAGCSAVSERLENRIEAKYQADIAREQDRLRREQEQRQKALGTFAERHHGRKPDTAA